MNEYRLFLLSEGMIQGRHAFYAQNDADAVILASVLAESLTDSVVGYELWDHSRCIVSTRDNVGPKHQHYDIDTLSEQRQWQILAMEDEFQRSHWRLAASRSLLDALGNLKRRLAID